MAETPLVYQEPVNRTRRFVFIVVMEAISLACILLLSLMADPNALTEKAVDAFAAVAVSLALAYVGGSAIDYSASMLSGRAATRSSGSLHSGVSG